MTWWLKRFNPLFTRIDAHQEIGHVGAQFTGRGDEEGASDSAQGNLGDERRGFLTILDNVLKVVKLAEGEEEAGWPHPSPRDLLEGVGEGGVRNLTAADFA
jgi:hypothetical protein